MVTNDWASEARIVGWALRILIPLDYISCALTLLSTYLVGKHKWQGWIVAGANSAIICVIGIRTSQFGFVPANLFCLGMYGYNVVHWRVSPGSSLPTTQPKCDKHGRSLGQ
jgi:hypothetical protein